MPLVVTEQEWWLEYANRDKTWRELLQTADYFRSIGDYANADMYYKQARDKKGGGSLDDSGE